MNYPLILFYLIGAHFLCDFPLQSEAIAINKNKNAKTQLQKSVPWYWWLIAHSFIHGMAVAIILNSVWFGLAETISHFVIDYCKCNKKLDINEDQALHIFSKLMWLICI